ncbi:hypothetical protein ACEQPO_24030 [Bacillus sp. SL00103]
MKKEDDTYSFIFQRETIKLLDGLDTRSKTSTLHLKKEIQLTEDEVIISIQTSASAYQEFRFIHAKDEKSKIDFFIPACRCSV